MATERFKAEFRSELGTLYEVSIHDSEWNDDPIEFRLGGDGFKLNFSGQNQKRWNPIIASECSFPMLIENSDHEDFIVDIVTATEGRFTVRIKQGSVLNYWVGFVLLDIALLEDAPFPYLFEVTAVDGLGLLRDAPFSDDGQPYEQFEDFVGILFKALKPADGLMAHFDTTDHYLVTAVEWVETRHGAAAANKDPLALTAIDHKIFWDADEKGVYKFKTCHEVLALILEAWCARIIWSRGSYHIEQINWRHEAAYFTRSYNKAGTLQAYSASAANSVNVLQTGGRYRLAGGTYTWWSAVSEAVVEYRHHSWDDLLGKHQNSWFSRLFNSIDPPIELLDLGIKTTHNLVIGGTLYAKATLAKDALVPPASVAGTLLIYSRLVFQLTIVVNVGGTPYYLKRTSSTQLNVPLSVDYTVLTWETAASVVEVSTEYSNLIDFEQTMAWTIWTPPLPVNADTLSVDLKFLEIRDMPIAGSWGGSFPNTVVPTTGKYAWQAPSIIVLENGYPAESEDTLIYKQLNTSIGGSEKYNFVVPFGDGPLTISSGRLKTYDGSTWADSGAVWNTVLSAFDRSFSEMCLHQLMMGSERPVKKVKGSVFGSGIYPISKIVGWTNTSWLLLGGTFTANYDEWTGEWFEINSLAVSTGGTTTTGTTTGTPNNGPGKKKGPGLVGDLPAGLVGIPGSGATSINPSGISSLSIFSHGKTDVDLAPGAITSIDVAEALAENAFDVGDTLYLINPLTGQYDVLTVTAAVADGDLSVAVSGTLSYNYPINATLLKDPTHSVKQMGGPRPVSLLRHWFSTTGPNLVFAVQSSKLLVKVVIISTSNCAVKLGTSALHDQTIMKTKTVAANIPLIYDAGYFFTSAGNIYVDGMAGTTKCYFWFL